MKRLVCGVGINDADYKITQRDELPAINGKRRRQLVWICPFYKTWHNMLERGYSSKLKERNPTYKDVFVNEEWHLFSNFKSWMQEQKWENNQLDKDILVEGNKEYSKDKCIFVPGYINKFILDSKATRGEWPQGVSCDKRDGKFKAECRDSRTGGRFYLGYFTDPQEAHLAWKECKHYQALQYANELEFEGYDQRLIQALRTRYL